MILKILFVRVLPFAVAFATGSLLVGLAGLRNAADSRSPESEIHRGYGSSSPEGQGASNLPSGTGEVNIPLATRSVAIKLKPRATYTDEARASNVQGTVRLKVVLLASGNIGAVSVVKGLPAGLTEQAIEAARHIVFEPATVNGKPISKIVTFDYGFSIY